MNMILRLLALPLLEWAQIPRDVKAALTKLDKIKAAKRLTAPSDTRAMKRKKLEGLNDEHREIIQQSESANLFHVQLDVRLWSKK